MPTEYDFTLETVRLYKKLFPDGSIIVSTWSDTPEKDLAGLRAEAGVTLLLTEKPPYPGYTNINYQIASTKAGIQHARSLGAEYIFKTRTDQRIYAPDVYRFAYGLLESFPLKAPSLQKKRLVALGMNTVKYRPYSLNDMFFFGTTHDMELYWDIPYDMRPVEKIRTVGELVSKKVCEIYLMTHFLKAIGHPVQDSLADYWDALGRYFIMVDTADLDFYWFKKLRYLEYRTVKYDALYLSTEIGFREWIILYQNLYKKESVPEYVWPSLPNVARPTKIPLHEDS